MKTRSKEKLMRAFRVIGGAIVLATVLAPAVRAQDTAEVRRLTILTFSAPVQLPGMTLPAGKYRFEMADVNNAAHTVRVLSEDGTKVLGTFSTIPTTIPTRDLRDTNTLVMWAERPAGQPQAAKEWYYPQRSIGEEFVYPRAQALALAAANHAAVASEENGKVVRVEGNETTDTTAAASTTATQTSETRVAENATPTPAPAREAAPVAVGTTGQSTTARPSPAPTRAPAPARRLPRTASQLALFELLSALSIAAALSVRQLRMRTAARG
jgi:hypothetical protein